MINSKQTGIAVNYTCGASVNEGDVVVMGRLCGVAVTSGQVGDVISVWMMGVFSIQKEDTDYVFEIGQRVYLTETKEATIHQSNVFLGHAWSGSGASDTAVDVRLALSGSLQYESVVFVENKEDFPEPVDGVHTLESEKTYILTTFVDLEGGRIEYDQAAIIGFNSETCGLKSTGKPNDVALISGIGDLPMSNLDIETDWAVDIDGTTKTTALDWKAVNFSNCPKVGVIKSPTNFVYTDSAFLNSRGLEFDGTIGTIAFDTCLFQGDGGNGAIIKVLSTCTVSRRFRAQFSSFICTSSTKGIDFSTSATVDNDQYILFRNNFSGGGTYTQGVLYSDNKSDWQDNKGIQNSATISEYYMSGNAVATVLANTTGYFKILGTTISDAITQRFTNTNNRATHIGALSGAFKVTAILSLNSGNNNQVYARVALNGTTLEASQKPTTTNGRGRAENIMLQKIVNLTGGANDYIEVHVRNATATTDIIVTELSVIIERLK